MQSRHGLQRQDCKPAEPGTSGGAALVARPRPAMPGPQTRSPRRQRWSGFCGAAPYKAPKAPRCPPWDRPHLEPGALGRRAQLRLAQQVGHRARLECPLYILPLLLQDVRPARLRALLAGPRAAARHADASTAALQLQ